MTPEASALYQEACSLEYQQDYTKAISKLQEAIKLSPEDSMLLTKLAGLYTDTNEYDKAVQIYSKAIELKPNDAFIYISLGSIYETQSKYKEALAAYEKALNIFPEYKYNYLNLANVQYQTKDYKSAIENYKIFLDTYSQHWEARKSLANSYLAADNPEKAVVEFENLYINNNEHFDDYANYGVALFKTGNYEKAVEMLEQAIAKDSNNLKAKTCLALTYQNLEKNDMALAQFESIFKNNDGDLTSVRFDYANLLADMGKNDEAIEQYKLYISAFPKDAKVYKNAALVYKRNNDLANAISYYQKSLTLNPSDIDSKKELAECYHLNKEYKNAIKYYDEILAANPDDLEVKTNKAIALHAQDDFEGAIALYNEILSKKDSEMIENNLTDAIISQADKDLQAKNYSRAIDGFIKAIARNSKDSYVYYGLAKAYQATGENAKATEYYEKAISMDPDRTEYSNDYAKFISEINAAKNKNTVTPETSELSNITLALPVETPQEKTDVKPVAAKTAETKPTETTPPAQDNSYIENIEKNKKLIAEGDKNYKKNYDEAIKLYKEALMLRPSDEETLLKIGNLYRNKKDNNSAIDFYKKAIFVKPEYDDGWFNLGLVYAEQKNTEQSKKCFEKVVEINPAYANAYYALGAANESEKNINAAILNYEKFLKYNKDTSYNSTIEAKLKNLKK